MGPVFSRSFFCRAKVFNRIEDQEEGRVEGNGVRSPSDAGCVMITTVFLCTLVCVCVRVLVRALSLSRFARVSLCRA
jgi:hypothetical protein